jgi:ABC-type polysaccharide/polyol phosphate export permease
VLPFSVVMANVVELAITSAILLVVASVQVGSFHITSLALALIDVALLLWVAGLTVLVASLNAFRRDLNIAMPLILRVLFILTPVMYPVSVLDGGLRWMAELNPLTVVITATRDVVARGVWPDWTELGAVAASGLAVFVGGLMVARRFEHRLADIA